MLELSGNLTHLRSLAPTDQDALIAIMTDPTVSRWWGQWDNAKIQAELIAAPEKDGIVLGIEVDGQLAGIIQFYEEPDEQYRHAAVDIALGSAWQGRGIGPDAIRTLIHHLFKERGHHRITIDPAASNEAAIRAYTKIGFKPIGIMRQYEQGPDGAYHDGLLMDLIEDEFI